MMRMTADRLAASLRGFGPLGILAILLVVAFGPILEPFGPLVAVLWVGLSRTPWRELGVVRPARWIGTVAAGIAFGAAFKLLLKVIVMPLLGAPSINTAFQYLAGNPTALPQILTVAIFGAGFGEELVFRGFMFERLGRLLGPGVKAKATIVLLTSVMFALIHYPLQGIVGVEQASITGLVFGTIFAITGRLVFVMIAHAAFDVVAVFVIYFKLESYLAHLVFN